MMEEAGELLGYAGMENPPSFYTVNSLTNSLVKKVKESKEAIQKNKVRKPVEVQ